MAAGYDKNGEVPDALLKLGFGFAEVGTVTPLPQAGNPKPRIFRLAADRAVINRLGFNNEGHERCLERLRSRAGRRGIVGVNIGANKDSADRVADYVAGVRRFAQVASYLTVNISSPNTPGLRSMQAREALAELLGRVMAARDAVEGRKVPVFLKIAPDLDAAELADIAAQVLQAKVEGVIVSNTTIARPALKSGSHRDEAGGLSGEPLFETLDNGAGAHAPPARAGCGADRGRRRRFGRDGDRKDPRRRRPRAALHRNDLPGPVAAGAHRARPADICRREKVATIRGLRDSSVDRWADRPID